MPAGRPTLEVLRGGPSGEPDPAAPTATPGRVRGWSPGWILTALLCLALLALAVQTRRAAKLGTEVTRLSGQVTQLQGELAETRSELEAHRNHLDAVRSAVDRLQELVRSGPAGHGEPR